MSGETAAITAANAELVIAITGLVIVYTTSVVSLVLWLSSKFRALEVAFYREMDKHREDDAERFTDHAQRLQVLELERLGYTIGTDRRK